LQVPHLEQNILDHKAKLAPKVNGDPTVALLEFWKRMEIRAVSERLGLTLIDAATGVMRYDVVKFNQLYTEALNRGDHQAMLALEEWPIACPVDPALVSEGQATRLAAADPVTAQKLEELEALHQAYTSTLQDALQELPLPQSDLIAEVARGERHAHGH
jgi:hypothetical protein